MEFDFKANLKETRDIDIYEFDKKIDTDFDYINDIDVDIKWRAVMYMKDYGITDNWPVIDEISLDMDYQLLEEDEGDSVNEEEKNYKLHLTDFLTGPLGTMEDEERKQQPYEEKKWVVECDYSARDENDTTLYITSMEIDFEKKKIIVIF